MNQIITSLIPSKFRVTTLASFLVFCCLSGAFLPALQAEDTSNQATFSHMQTSLVVVGWTFPVDNQVTADQGAEMNLNKTISRESAYTGAYSWFAGATTRSISSVQWHNGVDSKSWVVEFSTLGFTDLTISSAQRSSDTGPANFKLQYRIGEGEWSDVRGASITVANDNFVSGKLTKVALPAEMWQQPSVSLRWVVTSTTAVNNATVASAGTSRIDNIIVEGVAGNLQLSVASVKPVNNIIVAKGTPFQNLNLPSNVEVILNTSQVVTMAVNWLSSGYNGDVVAEYLIEGELVLTGDISNPGNVKAKIKVNVLEEIVILEITNGQVFDNTLEVQQGTTFNALQLPAKANFILANSSEILLNVVWKQGIYDPAVPGLYNIEGEPVLASGIANTARVVAIQKVKVIAVLEELVIAGWNFNASTHETTSGIPGNNGSSVFREPQYTVTYTFPAGASGNALSSRSWHDGIATKYWWTTISTSGYWQLNLSSKQRSSSTGPKDFKIQYRLGNTGEWTDIDGSTITNGDSFSVGVITNLSLPEECNNKPILQLRWVLTSNIAVNGGAIGPTGTSAIDDIVVKGFFNPDFRRTITDIEPLPPVVVLQGTPANEVVLPPLVTVVYDSFGKTTVPVVWNLAPYNGNTLGDYQLTGQLQLPLNMVNPDEFQPVIVVKVVPEIRKFNVTFNVDMTGAPGFNAELQDVYITGSMFNYAFPGQFPEQQKMQSVSGNLFTKTLNIQEGDHIYKYYIGTGLSSPEPGADRRVTVSSDITFNDIWSATSVDNPALIKVMMYPNPGIRSTTISSDMMINEIMISDVSGRTVYSKKLADVSTVVDLTNLHEGMYLVRIKTDAGVVIQKLIIRR